MNKCEELWICSGWKPEQCEKIQKRDCTDLNNCSTTEQKPVVQRLCPEEDYLGASNKNETCFDNLKNQDEEKIDCGGICEKCFIKEIPMKIKDNFVYFRISVIILDVLYVGFT